MDTGQMRTQATESDHVIIKVPRSWKHSPVGFPRGTLLCEQDTINVIQIDSKKLLAWLDKYGL